VNRGREIGDFDLGLATPGVVDRPQGQARGEIGDSDARAMCSRRPQIGDFSSFAHRDASGASSRQYLISPIF
jgi:hypothetical protein